VGSKDHQTRKLVWSGKIYKIYEREVTLANGLSEVFEILEAPDVVRVYPIRTGQIILISEYRPLQERRVLRVPAGRIEPGEQPIDAAKRELAEEVGITADRWEAIGSSKPILKIDHTVYHFLATELTFGEDNLEPGEDIAIVPTDLSDIPNLVASNQIEEEVVALRLLQLCDKDRADRR
jgi:ADP-ribose pyrophosphatase